MCEENGNYEAALLEHKKKIRLLEEQEEKNGRIFADRGEMMERKAKFLIHLKRFDEAVRIFRNLIAEEKSRQSKGPEEEMRAALLNIARYYYLLSTAYLESYLSVADRKSLKEAENYAIYAFNARHELFKDNPAADDLVSSAELCVKIYNEKNDTTTADEYRNYIPKLSPIFSPPQNLGSDLPSSDGLSNHKGSESPFNIYDSWDNKGKTPLIRSINEGNYRRVRECLHGGADAHLKSMSGTPPIIYAADSGSEIFKMLLEKGADIDDVDKDGFTGLHRAIIRGNPEAIRLLIENNANVDSKDRRGLTPLMRAVQKNNSLAVKILISGGANLEERSSDGWSAVHYAISTDAAVMVRLLEEEGADINAECKGGKTPLHYTCETGAKRCAETLIELKAEVTALDKGGRSPPCLAMGEIQDELVHLLLTGATPNETAPSTRKIGENTRLSMRRFSEDKTYLALADTVASAPQTRHSSKFASWSKRFSVHKSVH